MKNSFLYLDYNATHPPDSLILEKAFDLYKNTYANTSGRSYFSQKSKMLLYQYRMLCADLFRVRENQILFSSSASESNVLIIRSLIEFCLQEMDSCIIFMTPFEHPSIMNILATYINNSKVNIELLTLEEITGKELFSDKVKEKHPNIVICTHSHNETGIRFPVNMLSEELKKHTLNTRNSFLVIDAVQSLSKWNASNIENELLSIINQSSNNFHQFWIFSGHKVGAGFGCSISLVSSTFNFDFLARYSPYGEGSHEYGIRAGTHNIYSIIAFALVLEKRFKQFVFLRNLELCTKSFEMLIYSNLQDVEIIGEKKMRYPGTTMLVLKKNIDIDLLLMRLDQKRIIISTGTSCKSGSRQPSVGLLALGYSTDEALSVLRFSYGIGFTEKLQKHTLKIIKEVF